jgi:hypothetical protein
MPRPSTAKGIRHSAKSGSQPDRMSALGQKAEVEQHPALVRFAPAPRTRASLKTVAMSVWCHDQTHAPRQTIALFNHLIDTTAEPDPHGFGHR